MADRTRFIRRYLVPHPAPSTHPLPKKIFFWILVLFGEFETLGWLLIANGYNQPHHAHNHVSAVFAVLSMIALAWFGWFTHRIPLVADSLSGAQVHLRARHLSREILRDNPELATELAIGRPDVASSYDDGGLLDVNNVAEGELSKLAPIGPELAKSIVATRSRVNGFESLADFERLMKIVPQRFDSISDRLIFRNYEGSDQIEI